MCIVHSLTLSLTSLFLSVTQPLPRSLVRDRCSSGRSLARSLDYLFIRVYCVIIWLLVRFVLLCVHSVVPARRLFPRKRVSVARLVIRVYHLLVQSIVPVRRVFSRPLNHSLVHLVIHLYRSLAGSLHRRS